MLKIKLIQRGDVTTHEILHNDTEFDDFIELVAFENFGKPIDWDRQNKSVFVSGSETNYTMLELNNAVRI